MIYTVFGAISYGSETGVPSDSLLAHEGSAGLRSHGTHGRLSDKGTLKAGRDSCVSIAKVYRILSIVG